MEEFDFVKFLDRRVTDDLDEGDASESAVKDADTIKCGRSD